MPQPQDFKEVVGEIDSESSNTTDQPAESQSEPQLQPPLGRERKSNNTSDRKQQHNAISEMYLSPAFLGQLLLPKPNTKKTTNITSCEFFTVCVSSMQGWRLTMEDTCAVHINFPSDETNTSMIGIFDGHGGITVADYVARNLHKFILKQNDYKDNLKKAIIKGFIELDAKMKREQPDDQSGSTAVTVFMRNNILYCGNLGDSRAIACDNNQILPLSYDHKPTSPLEYKRIIDSGCWVEAERVNGSLALSRAFGDYQFKLVSHLRPEQQAVSCVPDVTVKKIDKQWKFVFLACDGIWEVMCNEKVGDFIKRRLAESTPLDKICENLMTTCLATRTDGSCLGCDNMTVALIVFNWPT